MKNWKINEIEQDINIYELLKEYCKGLETQTEKQLKCYVSALIVNKLIRYDFYINDSTIVLNTKLFSVTLNDLEKNATIELEYIKKDADFVVPIIDLEKKLDEIIQSDDMSQHIGHLLYISKKLKK